jgi:hypothetical protein
MIIILPLIVLIGILAWILRPYKGMNNSSKAAMFTAIVLSVVVAITAIALQLLHNSTGKVEVSEISNILFIIGFGLIVVYILTSIGFVIAHRGDIARGIGFGACIAVIISIIELGFLEWLGGV